MTPTPVKALVAAALFVAVTSTPSDAASQNKNISFKNDPHARNMPVYGPQPRSISPGPGVYTPRVKRPPPARPDRKGAHTNRACLTPDTQALLARLEARFGAVEIVSTCRPGARMPSGDVSWHARNRAFDFKVGKGVDKRDVMVWLGKNSPGVTMSYRSMPHIHTDTGTFHKVIYAAADHEAGERAVAIWMARAAVIASGPPLPKPRPEPQPFVVASLGDDAWREEPLEPKPSPVTWGDRRDIFRRYVESKDVVVKPWVTTTCPGGRDLPNGLQALLRDAVNHFHCPVYVNSAYRSPSYNRRVGGARNSQHTQCRAVDFRVACVAPSELKRWVMANLARWGIGGLGTYGSHVHADVRPLAKAQRVVTWTGGHKKKVRYAKHRKPNRYSAG